jgi:mono/diheme cytochrome c family protein
MEPMLSRPRGQRLPCHTAALGLALILQACGQGAAGEVEPDPAALATFQSAGCAVCHAPDGAGTAMGPPLRELGRHWKREQLADYLRDPGAWIEKVPRLAQHAQRFPLRMPVPSLTSEQRETLAGLVLSWR